MNFAFLVSHLRSVSNIVLEDIMYLYKFALNKRRQQQLPTLIGRMPFPEDRHRRSLEKEPVMPGYLRFLPYRRLFCLVLAASQLMPLPDSPEIHRHENILPIARMFPDDNQTPNK
jgi:hypothetical protein